jgi:hypothetical protein
MDIGPQDSIREFYHGVAEVDDSMAGKGLDIAPLRVSSRRKNLETSKTIEEESDAAKVGVLPKRDAPVIDGLWWGFDESDVITARAVQSVETGQRVRRQTEMFTQEF